MSLCSLLSYTAAVVYRLHSSTSSGAAPLVNKQGVRTECPLNNSEVRNSTIVHIKAATAVFFCADFGDAIKPTGVVFLLERGSSPNRAISQRVVYWQQQHISSSEALKHCIECIAGRRAWRTSAGEPLSLVFIVLYSGMIPAD